MSLFDVIKYPLSTPVLVAEFDALPVEVRNRYQIHWNSLSSNEKFDKPAAEIRDILTKLLLGYNEFI